MVLNAIGDHQVAPPSPSTGDHQVAPPSPSRATTRSRHHHPLRATTRSRHQHPSASFIGDHQVAQQPLVDDHQIVTSIDDHQVVPSERERVMQSSPHIPRRASARQSVSSRAPSSATSHSSGVSGEPHPTPSVSSPTGRTLSGPARQVGRPLRQAARASQRMLQDLISEGLV